MNPDISTRCRMTLNRFAPRYNLLRRWYNENNKGKITWRGVF